jgi:glycosyltransferase involved in cell wall biosynthesis
VTRVGQTVEVVLHDASRSGAVHAGAGLIAALGGLGAAVDVRLLAPGPLVDELGSTATDDGSGLPAAVILNSVLALGALDEIDPTVPVALYLHEDEETLQRLGPDRWEAVAERCRAVWCVAPAVADELVSLGVPAASIAVLPPVPRDLSADPGAVERARAELGAGDRALLVGCGEASWHKGPDLFLDVLRRVRAQREVVGAWVGRQHRDELRRLRHDASLLKLDDAMTWVPQLDDVAAHLAAADVVVMPSRRDAQPLVPFEAASLGTPTAGFRVGGLRGYADRGLIAAADYPDTAALATEILSLLDDAERSDRLVRATNELRRQERSLGALTQRLAPLLDSLTAPAPTQPGGRHG